MIRLSVLILLSTAAFSQSAALENRSRLADFALVLEDPPVAAQVETRAALQGAEAQAHMGKLRGAQRTVIAELGRRKVTVTSTAQVLVNAIFVRVPRENAAELKSIPGVKWIQY